MNDPGFEADDLASFLLEVKLVTLSDLRAWFSHDDVEVRSVAFNFLHSEGSRRLQPAISSDEAHELTRVYLMDCMVNDYSGDWSLSRYEASWTAGNVVKHHWGSLDMGQRQKWLEWARCGILRSPEVSIACETGFLEHVIVDDDIWRDFSTLLSDPNLTVREAIARCARVVGRRVVD